MKKEDIDISKPLVIAYGSEFYNEENINEVQKIV